MARPYPANRSHRGPEHNAPGRRQGRKKSGPKAAFSENTY